MERLKKLLQKNNLDEMQEQSLRKIESGGCWLAWTVLLVVCLVEWGVGCTPREIAGEWIAFMLLCVYMLVGCIRAGIWDRRLKPTMGMNLCASAVGGVVLLVFFGIKQNWVAGIITGVFTTGLTFAVMQACTEIYKARRQKLDEADMEPTDEEKNDGNE